MKKWIKRIGIILLVLFLMISVFLFRQLRDRHPGYKVDISIENLNKANLKAGFAALPITPTVTDTWTDKNGDAQYNPEDGDTYEDVNQNGKFDAVWIAGFHNRRAANGVHDDLWARVMVLNDNQTTIAVAALDCIGLGSDDIIAIRKMVKKQIDVDYVIITSSHTHEGPDVIGIWGASQYKNGVDKKYIKYLREQTTAAIIQAYQQLRPASLKFAQDLHGAKDLVEDSRKPIVLDERLQVIQAIDTETDTTLGTLLAWANHPETLWDKNLLITSDFPHYFRNAVENGIQRNGDTLVQGVGGTAVFVNGAIGGLMTSSPTFPIQDPFLDTAYLAPTFQKAQVQGEKLGILALHALKDSSTVSIKKGAIQLRAKSVTLPMDNKIYRLAAILGVLDKGFNGWMTVRSEIAYWKLGPATFLHQPGEIYPEIINGGIEIPNGQDFEGQQIIETPPLRSQMSGDFKFTVGLSNDMIGYIIPKSQWDAKPPYTYEYEEDPYGEINSLGDKIAPILHRELSTIIGELEE